MGVYRDARKDFVWQKDFPALSDIERPKENQRSPAAVELNWKRKDRTGKFQIIQPVRSMNMKLDEFAAFLCSGALNAAPTVTLHHKQEDAADET